MKRASDLFNFDVVPGPRSVFINKPDPDSANEYFSVSPISFNKNRFP